MRFVRRQLLHRRRGVFEGLGLASDRSLDAVSWETDHADAIVGIGAISAAPGRLRSLSVAFWNLKEAE